MICPWDKLLAILPTWVRTDVDRFGKQTLQELRMRINSPPELILSSESLYLNRCVCAEDIAFTVNTASRYSPWASTSVAKGYITAPGGHRIGLCGEVVCKNGTVTGMREIHSLNIRVARDFPGIGEAVLSSIGSVLILGAPGWGKTTLLRDMIRQISRRECISVVDERGELFPIGVQRGKRMDVLMGASKSEGIEMVLRVMGPQWIAVDEITAEEDCAAILRADRCGVKLMATAHGSTLDDFYRRHGYGSLVKSKVFDTAYILRSDKSFRVERMT